MWTRSGLNTGETGTVTCWVGYARKKTAFPATDELRAMAQVRVTVGEATLGDDFVVLRDDDPRRTKIEALGYTIVGQSWGARLRLADAPDLTIFRRAVSRAHRAGISIAELSVSCADDLHTLEVANNADYPYTPATSQELLDADAIRNLWERGCRVFGAWHGDLLVGATVILQRDAQTETEFTSVLASYRGRGIGAAVKAASVIACADQGARVFGTGGAAANDASLGVNRALGYEITERWYSYQPAGDRPENSGR
jgi:GNAT superfamily N-acetyltransferase